MRAECLESEIYSLVVGRMVWITGLSQGIWSKEEYGTGVH